ncbi:hypothetical protein D3C79_611780 [compost metagenome]
MAQYDVTQRQALGAGGADEVGVHGLDHAAAHDARDGGDVVHHHAKHRQHHELHPSPLPAPGGEPAKVDAEEEHQQGRQHEARDHHPGHGRRHQQIVDDGVLFERRYGAEDGPQHHRQHEGRRANLGRDRQRLADQIVDAEVLVLEGGTQIALQQVAQIGEVLHAYGLVQAVFGLDVGQDFRRQGAFAGKGVTRSETHHEEGDGDQDQQGRDRFQ